ncbi:hypothetical protein GLOIN_2v1781395 [Rhizophagus clarus]|uniref:Uncharacterized protein n=1 Tax=Rhizophagus clarus TaxID=94130 RepID=A0A8H3KTL5_9GLOM|nr:hypothetical protein GLOIN_2v1781395 [Rhizophagus clarus]
MERLLCLSLNINESDFKVFIEDSKNIIINKLVIDQQGSDYILHYIREFIMKEKRVKYLAFNNEDNGDLFNLENEVEEFKLQNVSIRNIYDLFLIIGSHGFIKNI